MGAPIALFIVIPAVILILVGLVLVVRALFFGAKETAKGVEEHVEADENRKRGFFG